MKCVFFDLDNTLTDRKATVDAYAEYFLADFREFLNPEVSAKYIAEVFNDLDNGGYETHERRSQLISELKIWKAARSVDELSFHWQNWVPNNSAPMAGLYQCLDELLEMGLKLCLVTNGQSKNQRDKIRKLSLAPYFDQIVISEEVGFKKPDRRIFQKAVLEMDCRPEDAFFVGDHPINDYIGSTESGFVGIWLEGAHPWPNEYPQPLRISHLNQLCPLVRKF